MFQSLVLLNKTKLKSDFLQEDVWNLLDNTFTIPKISNYTFYEVNEDKYIGRPDLISIDAYGDAMYADVICKLNGISNPFELNMGTLLILPGADEITQFTHTVPIREIETNNDIDGSLTVLGQKRRSDERRPGEALIGDTRFKIDKNKGIVIY